MSDSLLQLQRGYGNRFVQRLLATRQAESPGEGGQAGQALGSASAARGVRVHTGTGVIRRLVGETKGIEQLRTLLKDGDEAAAIALMGRLEKDEVGKILENREFKELATSAFNNAEMDRAATAMAPKGSAYRLLEWVFDEGTDWGSVRALLPQLVNGRKNVLADRWMRDQFVSLCNNEEMAEAVRLLSGTLVEQLDWMIAEGTSDTLVHQAIRLAPQGELEAVKKNDTVMAGLAEELSADGLQTARQMLGGLLFAETVKGDVKQKVYEQETPTSPWELQDSGWQSRYEIRYSRDELRLVVRIQLTGHPVPAAQRIKWAAGVANRWNGKFHLENDRRLPLIVEPVFTPEGAHHKVEVHSGGDACARENMSNWCATSTPDTVAHEVSHMLGLEDEYRRTREDYQRLASVPAPAGPAPAGYTILGLMDDGTGDVQRRHLQPFLRWLNAHRVPGEKPYRLVAGG